MKWYLKVLLHYADFGGRARRKEFWYFVLFNFIASVVAMSIDLITYREVPDIWGLPCLLNYGAAVLLPGLAVTVRRLHDLGKNGLWLLISLIPIVGSIWLVLLCCTEGEKGKNRYGANPKYVKQYFSELRRRKSIATAVIVGEALLSASYAFLLTYLVLYRSLHDLLFGHFPVLLIMAIVIVLNLFFGVFYYPVGDPNKTAKRQNIAFVLLAIAVLINLLWGIGGLIIEHETRVLVLTNNIVGILTNLSLLSLILLLLLKSKPKNRQIVSGLTILFLVINIVILLVMKFQNYDPLLFRIISKIAFILFAVDCFQGKTPEAAEEEESISSETGNIKVCEINKV